MAAFSDHYRTLGVHRHAEAAVVEAAYRAMARRYHPDLNPGNRTAEDRLKAINEAYAVLSNPSTRRAYDREWDAQHAPKPRAQPKPSTPPPPPPSQPSRPPARTRPWYVKVLAVIVFIGAARAVLTSVANPEATQLVTIRPTATARIETPMVAAVDRTLLPQPTPTIAGVVLSLGDASTRSWGFIDQFDPPTAPTARETANTSTRVTGSGLEIAITAPGGIDGYEYPDAPSGGQDIGFAVDIASTAGWGEIILDVRAVAGEPKWTFAIDPVAEQWSLYRASTTTRELFYWVEPRPFTSSGDEPVRRIEVRVERGTPTLLINGRDVVSALNIEMPKMMGSLVLGFGAGINPYSLTGSGDAFTVVFASATLRELP